MSADRGASLPACDGYVVTWERALASENNPREGVWLVCGGADVTVDAAVAALGAHGASVRGLSGGQAAEAIASASSLAGVVHVAALDLGSDAIADAADFDDAAIDLCLSVAAVVRALASARSSARIWVVTRGVLTLGPASVPTSIAQSPAWGFGRVVGLEHPEIWGGLVDLDPGTSGWEGIERILTEAAEDQLAVREGLVYVPRLRPEESHRSPPVVRDHATYVITGGLGALGVAVADRLVESGARHLALLARRPADEATCARLDRWRRSGVVVDVAQADVSDADDMRRVFVRIAATMPPVRGVVHAAGVNGQRPVAEITAQALKAVFSAKVSGAWLLHELTRDLALDFFVCFSSIGSVWGSKGQAHHGAANAFLDGLVSYRLQRGLPALAVQWGPWAAAKAVFSGERAVGIRDRGDQVSASITLSDDEGVVAEVADIVLRQAVASRLLPADPCYVTTWQEKPLARPAAVGLPDVETTLSRVRAARAEADVETRVASLEPTLAALETLAAFYVAAAVRGLGVNLDPGTTFSESDAYSAAGGGVMHRRLFARLLAILEEEGILRKRATGADRVWVVAADPPAVDLDAEFARLLAAYPAAENELRILDRCGRQLANVILGTVEPLPLLFPADDPLTASQLYVDSPGAQLVNHLLRRTLEALIAEVPADAPLRVLEVGAGTGGTTAQLLPLFPPGRTAYRFTDVSPRFVAEAKGALAAWSFVEYSLLDIERDPVEQGFAAGGYDVVIAANVLHATRDLVDSVRHVRRLLAPGGVLVALEGIRPLRFVDVIFGLTSGWWRFEDTHLRQEHPLVPAAAWRALAAETGFDAAVLADEAGLFSSQGIIVAKASGPAEPYACAVIVGDRGGVGSALARLLLIHGVEAIVVAPEGDLAPAFRDARASRLPFRHLVHLCALNLSGDVSDDLSALDAQLGSLCAGALDTIAAAGLEPVPPRLWLVTRGAQPADGRMSAAGCAQAVLCGLARTLAIEHPELGPVRIDLDPQDELTSGSLAEAVVQEILAAEASDEVALRGSLRLVPRLARLPVPAAPPEGAKIRDDRVYVVTGGLGGLGLLTAGWLIGQGARHIMLVARSAPEADTRRRIAAWGEDGVDVVVARCDVSNRQDLAVVLAAARIGAPLGGVVHAAGTRDDGLLAHQDWSKFQRVFASKVSGAWNLHRLTAGDPLDFFVLYASTAGVLGSRGQANRGAACAFEDALAWHRAAAGLPALTIDWGAWSAGGDAARWGVEERAGDTGVGTIDPGMGMRVLGGLLGQHAPQVVVAPVDWAALVARFPSGRWPELLADLIATEAATPARAERSVSVAPVPAADAAALAGWNQTDVPSPDHEGVHEAIDAQARRTPDAIALVLEGQRWTYRELIEQADALAGDLLKLGVGPDVLVGICMHRSREMVVSILAVLKAGGAWVPLDPDDPRERLHFMLDDAKVAVLLSGRKPPRRTGHPAMPVARRREPGPDNLAYMIYTSGSTGRPDGAMNTHRGLCNRLTWMQSAYGLDESDAVLQKALFSLDVSVWEMLWPLMTGARLVLCRPGGDQDPQYLAALMRDEEITTVHFAPSMLGVFLDQPDLEPFPMLRRVICSGEALPPDLAQRAFALGADVYHLYGPTETAIDVTAWPCRVGDVTPTVPIGSPIANTRIHVVDEAFNPCPIGVPGELCIAGVNVGRGYHARPDLTADRFVPDPLGPPGSRMFRTGDLAQWQPSGSLIYLGRLSGVLRPE
jgi:amino acid adenylation domain-containing protein